MPYSIIETPDHLHRGLHLFAAANLNIVTDWLDTQVKNETLRERRLPPEQTWFLASLDERGLVRDLSGHRFLARKQAQEFFKQHPEMRRGATFRTSPYPMDESDASKEAVHEEQYIRDWWADYVEFEYDQEIHGNPQVTQATEDLRSAIRTKSISAITEGIESLSGVLAESGLQHRFVFEAMEVLHDLLESGVNDSSRYLGSDVDEAFEVTNLCNGRFRQLAARSVEYLRTISPTNFECLCAELLGQFGLEDIEITPVVADGGIDVVAFQILDGTRIKYVIQCKRNSAENKVDVCVVRELVGVKMDSRADRALVITTSQFTKPARDFARRTRAESWGVRLVDHKLLQRLLDCT